MRGRGDPTLPAYCHKRPPQAAAESAVMRGAVDHGAIGVQGAIDAVVGRLLDPREGGFLRWLRHQLRPQGPHAARPHGGVHQSSLFGGSTPAEQDRRSNLQPPRLGDGTLP